MEKMQHALDTEESPLDAKLDHVIPGLKEWHSVNNQAVAHLDRKVDARFTKIEDILQECFGSLSMKADRQEKLLRQKLANTLMSVATDLLHDDDEMDEDYIPDEELEDHFGETTNAAQEQRRSYTGVPLGHRAPTVAALNVPVNDAPASAFKHIQLTPKHSCLSDLWDEWYGLGKYTQVPGGINWLETKYKNKWRAHIDGNLVSRTKRLIKAMSEMSSATRPVEEVIAERSQDFLDCHCSVGVLVEHWKTMNYITKKAPRGRKSKQAIQQQQQQTQ
jgi:Transcriptional activator of glycolytic enzymes